jgi:hypothetical protein
MPFLYQGRLLHCWFVKDWYDGNTFNHTLLLKHHQSHSSTASQLWSADDPRQIICHLMSKA